MCTGSNDSSRGTPLDDDRYNDGETRLRDVLESKGIDADKYIDEATQRDYSNHARENGSSDNEPRRR